MTTLYIQKNGAKLEKRQGSILATSTDEKVYYPLEQVDKIVLFGNIQVSNPLISELGFRKIPIYYYSYGGNFKGVFLPAEKNVSKVRLYQYKTYFNEQRRLELAKQIITVASKNKVTILKRYFNKKQNKEIELNVNRIRAIILNMQDCGSIEELRGYEGSITRLYFSCFKVIFKNYDFDERTRQPPQNELNALFSFGYSILYNDIQQMVYETGLDMFLGFIHEMENSKPSLVLDISEVFKQCVIDSLIFEMVNNNQFKEQHFNKKESICMLSNYGKTLFLKKYENKMQKTFFYKKIEENRSYRESIRIELYKLIKYLTEETEKFDGFRIY